MFFDLNIPFQGYKTDSIVSVAQDLGFGGIALNHTVIGSFEPKDAKVLPDLKSEPTTPPPLSIITSTQQQQPSSSSSSSSSSPAHTIPIKKYKRLTVVLNEVSQIGPLNSNQIITDNFDIVAVQPTDEKTFNAACATANVDIISLDVSTRLSFGLRPAIVHQATSRGIYFEVAYSLSLRDPSTLRYFVSTAVSITRSTRGKHFIISSGALSDMELRSPKDIANLCSLFGLAFSNGKETVQKAPQQVILHGELRTTPLGILKVVESSGPSWKKVTESELLPTLKMEPKRIQTKEKKKNKKDKKKKPIQKEQQPTSSSSNSSKKTEGNDKMEN